MSHESPVLVVGATGFLGFEIARLLRPSCQELRALIRATAAPEKRRALEGLGGVELIEGDLKDPASLDRACRGARAVVSTASAMLSNQGGDSIESVDERGQLDLVEAAQRAGVDRFVFVSFAPIESVDFALQRAKRRVESALGSSGLSYTVLQPSFFSEVWLSPMLGFDILGGRVRLLGDGTSRVSWISYRDVARFAVWSCGRSDSVSTTVSLGGPDTLSQRDVVAIFEDLGAPRPAFDVVPEAALEAQRGQAGNAREEAFASLMLGVARGHVVAVKNQLELLPGRLGTVREYAREVLSRSKEAEE